MMLQEVSAVYLWLLLFMPFHLVEGFLSSKSPSTTEVTSHRGPRAGLQLSEEVVEVRPTHFASTTRLGPRVRPSLFSRLGDRLADLGQTARLVFC